MSHHNSNRLINETSPYLLQHAHNPVDWHPWGKAALEKALQDDKMILVSIGYSACHWCHVMERESFEDDTTAAIMNEHFINIKVDREERPDIDQVYMDAVQAISGSGGWPLNVFLTPDAKPFYGGTYFPPVKAFNRSSWTDVLQQIIAAWQERRTEIEAQAENLTGHIATAANFSFTGNSKAAKTLQEQGFENSGNIFAALMKNADREWGGFGRAPKFPQTFSIGFLFRYHHYTGDIPALEHALLSIDKMLQGGIYDHVGGGLARYSTDHEWLAPHFEKMLYDNALLIIVLCDAFQVTRDEKYRRAIHKTTSFVTGELRHPAGGFYAALDADSEGEEGRYYVWSHQEIVELLGVDAALFCEYFDVSAGGNWEGKNILRIPVPAPEFLAGRQMEEKVFEEIISRCLNRLKAQRATRVRPGLDDKVILSWNAMMIKALAKAATVLDHNEYRALAVEALEFITQSMGAPGSPAALHHTWKNGEARHPGFLDDYACIIDACLAVYELGFEPRYLELASDFCRYTIDHFSDEEDLFFFYTHKNQDDIIVRKKEIYDGATASANAVMAGNLARLSIIFDEPAWRSRANSMLELMMPAVSKYPSSFGYWASLLVQMQKGFPEIVVVGPGAFLTGKQILAVPFLPGRIIMCAESGNPDYPMLKGKEQGETANIYICENYMCKAPVKTMEEFLSTIGR